MRVLLKLCHMGFGHMGLGSIWKCHIEGIWNKQTSLGSTSKCSHENGCAAKEKTMKKWFWTFSAIGLLTVGCGDLQASNSLVLPLISEAILESDTSRIDAKQSKQFEGELIAEYTEAEYSEAESTQPSSTPTLEPLTTLAIRYDTPSLDGVSLSRGLVDVKVSYTAREDITEENRPLLRYEILYNGELKVKDYVIAVGSGDVLIGDFDQDGGMEVGIQAFTGGAHCCTSTTVYSWRDNDFVKLSLDELLSGDFEDIDGDGSFEFVTVDSNFLAKFSSYAGSVAPPMIFSLIDGNFVNSTQNYPDYIYAEIAELERQGHQMNAHSLLAAYVANKSLVGEVESGWTYLFNHYSQDPLYGQGMDIRNQNGEVIGQHPNFPTALKAFLIEQGYL